MNVFREAARVLNNAFVKEWKASGKKVVGYTCSYVPDEVLHAGGILPYRLRGFGAEGMTIGDTYFGPFICSLPKCMLQLAGQGDFDFLDGAIITPGCDSMRRIDECWRTMAADAKAHMPPFFFHFGVPHKYADFTVAWFKQEILRLIRAIEGHFASRIDDDRLKESIRLYNRTRSLMSRLEGYRSADEPRITGADTLAVALASTAMQREKYADMLEQFLARLERDAPAIRGRRRLMLVGSASDDVELMRLIEGERALVVADTICFGSRAQANLVEEAGDPIEALSRRYLSLFDCPRMYGRYEQRLESIAARAEQAKVDGVILQNIRFCDLHGAENGLLERDLEAKGIPCLRLEREYGQLVESGRMKMRIDAFLERLAQERPQ